LERSFPRGERSRSSRLALLRLALPWNLPMPSGVSRNLVVATLLILALAAGVRVVAARFWEARLPADQCFGWGDSDSYWTLGESLYEGQPYQYGGARIFRAPGYPALIAGAFAVWGGEPPVSFVRMIGVVVGTLTVAATMALASRFFSQPVVLGSGLVAALLPDAAGMSVFILSEGLFCLFITMQLWALVIAGQSSCRRRTLLYSALAGGFAGAAILTRPSWILFPLFAIVVALLFLAGRRKAFLVHGVALATLCVAMAPWWVRNYAVSGRFVPTTLQVGASLYDGWRPGADGASDMQFVAPMSARFRAEHPELVDTPDEEAEFDRYLRDAAIRWAAENPLEAARLALVKLARMWSPLPNAEEMRSPAIQLGMLATYVPLMIGAAGGAWAFLRRRRDLIWLIAPAAYFALLHLVFVSSIRYRGPVLPLLGILAVAWYCSFRISKDSLLKNDPEREPDEEDESDTLAEGSAGGLSSRSD
jgi:4-amino-4-deoxy-L-arabinose transferase-like glycosyltransferase